MSSILFWFAAGLAVVTLAVHVIAGEARVMKPMLTSDLPKQIKGLLYLGWHSASVAIAAIAICFAMAALGMHQQILASFATGLALSFVAVAFMTAMKMKLPPVRFPVIPLFGLVAAIGISGLAI